MVNKNIIILILVLLTGCSSDLNVEKLKDWGTDNFTTETWAQADTATRATMLYSMFKQHQFIGSDRREVIDLLGKVTGYYDYDINIAYVVGKTGIVKTEYADKYLLVFIVDQGKVIEIKITPEL